MKIRLAILDEDKKFLDRLSSKLSGEYEGKFELYLFSNMDLAIEHVNQSSVEVFLASENFDIDRDSIPERCGFAYFSTSKSVKRIRNVEAVCKFQSIDSLYKAIIGLYSDHTSSVKLFSDDGDASIVCFTAAAGGNGCSTCAAAFAKTCARKGKKTLYLNLNPFEDVSLFFSADGTFTFSDVIYSVKQKSNLSLKIESCVKKDESGVYFFSSPESPMHMAEMNSEDVEFLTSSLGKSSQFDVVIIDVGFTLEEKVSIALKNSSIVVFVSNGSEASNKKFVKAFEALGIMEKKMDTSLIYKTKIFYNKFSTSYSTKVEICEPIGVCPRISNADSKQIVEQMVQRDLFSEIK